MIQSDMNKIRIYLLLVVYRHPVYLPAQIQFSTESVLPHLSQEFGGL